MLTVARLREFKDSLPEPPDQFFIIVHPDQHYRLKVAVARYEYYHKQWIPRWEQWSGRTYVEVKEFC